MTRQGTAVLALALVLVAAPVAAQKHAASQNPLAVVFDASESACGYFSPTDPDKVFLALINASLGMIDPVTGNNVYLLQQNSEKQRPAKEIVVAPEDLRRTAELKYEGEPRRGGGCSPFNGYYSRLDAVLAPESPVYFADTIVLVTDAELTEKERAALQGAYSDWANQVYSGGQTPYAGFAFGQLRYSGRYFPTGQHEQKGGYEVNPHNRPLFIFWFARSATHLKEVQTLVTTVLGKSAEPGMQVQHLLPVLSTGVGLFKTPAQLAPPLNTLLASSKPLLFNKYDPGRANESLKHCLHASINEQGLQLLAQKVCDDGKPLFEGVTSIRYEVDFAQVPYLTVADAADPNGASLSWTLTPKDLGTQREFRLQSRFDERTLNLDGISKGVDNCAQFAKKSIPHGEAVEACTASLEGKTFQVDSLVGPMVISSRHVMAGALDPLNARRYQLGFVSKSR
jgi:hypothetical protein